MLLFMTNVAESREATTSVQATTSQARPTLRCPVVACSVPVCQDGRHPMDSRGCLLCSCNEPSTITAPPSTSAVATSSSSSSSTSTTSSLPTVTTSQRDISSAVSSTTSSLSTTVTHHDSVTSQTSPTPRCRDVACHIHCSYGRVVDSRGCRTCRCIQPPSTTTAPTTTSTLPASTTSKPDTSSTTASSLSTSPTSATTTSSLSSLPTTAATTSRTTPTARCPVVWCRIPICRNGRPPVDSRGCFLCSCDWPWHAYGIYFNIIVATIRPRFCTAYIACRPKYSSELPANVTALRKLRTCLCRHASPSKTHWQLIDW